MTLNLIKSQAWKKDREKVCRMCKWFPGHFSSKEHYDWDNCSKSQQDDTEQW